MELREITEEVFTDFTKKHPLGTFLQTIEQKKLKEIYHNTCYLVGLFRDNKMLGASLLLSVPAKFGRTIFYAPRGFITDYDNQELVKSFTEQLVEFTKAHHGMELIIDPYIIYQVRGSDGSESKIKNDSIIAYLKSLGYHHYGFNLNFETSQVRFMYRINLESTYEKTMQNFSKSTKKRMEEMIQKGVKVRIATKEELPIVVELLKASAENKHFEFRSVSYYENFMKSFPHDMTIYISYVDFKEEEIKLTKLLEEAKEELKKVEFEMSKVNVGAKLLKKHEVAAKRIKKYQEELVKLKKDKEQYGNTVDIGALVSIRSNEEYITLSSGMKTEFRKFNPKYAMYQAHIKDAIKEGFSYVNFYGISGNFDPDSELYGIYDLKRGFNGNVIELIGEFSYPTDWICPFYHFLLKIKEKIKK